jgi:hypothetical protein
MPETRGDFFEEIATLEEDIKVNLSAASLMLEDLDYSIDNAALLQVGHDGNYTCAYLSDEQLVQLSAAISRYLGTEN